MKLLVSCPQTTREYAKYRLEKLRKGLLDGSSDVFAGDAGGEISLYEQEKPLAPLQRVRALSIDNPYAMTYVAGEGLYFTAGRPCHATGMRTDQRIVRIGRKGAIDLEIRSPLFSDLRAVTRTRDGLLVASGGIDALFEISLEGEVLWEWWATDQGFDRLPDGAIRQLQKRSDHRALCYPTTSQTTHINNVLEHPRKEGKVLASLFQQNCIIEIDRDSLRHRVVAGGLHRQHHIRATGTGFTVANTRNGEMLVFDWDFNVTGRVPASPSAQPARQWTQDALITPAGACLLADAPRLCVVEIFRDERAYHGLGAYDRVFQMEVVPDEFTLPLALPKAAGAGEVTEASTQPVSASRTASDAR